MKVKGKVFVVTGAGSGIGRELVLQLLGMGAQVAMIDLRPEGMSEVVKIANVGKRLSVHQMDIADRDAVYALPEKVMSWHGTVDGVINNAGIIQPFIPVNELDDAITRKIFEVNFYGTLHMVKAFLPHLLLRPEGHISNVSSMGGFIPFPGQTCYGASKAAVKLLTEGLRSELKETKVGLTLILAGAVSTNIVTNSGLEMKNLDAAKAGSMLSAPDAAKQIIRAMERNKFKLLLGKDAKFLDFLYRLIPSRASMFIARKMDDFK